MPRRPGRTVGPINGPHFYQASCAGRILGRDLNERTARKVRLNKMQRQDAKPKTRAQERKLGSEVGQAPDSRDLETESGIP